MHIIFLKNLIFFTLLSKLDNNVKKEGVMTKLRQYFSVAQAITLILHPHAEVVIHDLETGKIAAIYNNFSKRKVGEESLLDTLAVDVADLPDVFPVYAKTNWDGRKLKSSTATLRDKKDHPIGLLCINLDISKWEEFRAFLDNWVSNANQKNQPQILFQDDWKEKINLFVSEYLKEKGIGLKLLNKEMKKDLINSLHREGAFKAKNAATYVADVLDLSRATIYNYLRVKNENP